MTTQNTGDFVSPAENALNWLHPAVADAQRQHPDVNLPHPPMPRIRPKIWAPQYVIQASPLSKLFMAEWSNQCLKDPKRLVDPEHKFWVRIPRACGGIVMEHNVPQHVSKLLPYQDTREVTQDEVTPLVNWLCGGPDGNGEETDIYGVVAVEINVDITADLVSMLTTRVSAKAIAARQAEIVEQLQQQIISTREIADKRVKRALKATYNNLVAEWERIKQAGGGVYAPSVSEALAAHVLAEEIKSHAETTQAAFDLVAKAMTKPVGM